MRPYLLLDVDGMFNNLAAVSNVELRERLQFQGWVSELITISSRGTFRVTVNPAAGQWVLDLAAETGAELAWGTTWNHWANQHIGPLLGLPELPVAPVRGRDKAATVVPWTDGRPFVWLDDDPDLPYAVKRMTEATGQRGCVLQTDPCIGLTRRDILDARVLLRRAQHEEQVQIVKEIAAEHMQDWHDSQ